MLKKLSIATCTISPQLTLTFLHSILPYIVDDQIIVILDGKEYTNEDLSRFAYENGILLITNEKNMGLSYSRNVAMEKAENEYIIFFDDDTVLIDNVIESYKIWFEKGYDLLGGPLLLPRNYPKLPNWLPEGQSALFGIHINQEKIWGGNFGYNLKKAKIKNILFQINLGRKDGQLQAGDDTTFIKEYCAKNHTEGLFRQELAIEHHINPKRYTFRYLSRRTFWQGRCEIRRKSFFNGFIKEFKRNFHSNKKKYEITKFGMGAILFSYYITGNLVEILNLARKKI
ncbi:hypothetical protein GCM10008014_30440 [Paenibacillus silvae]|uniref:Glycosyltransferase 2-like domain-containing protein n=1 Tax=Paenibacillus silvae TaxID=1325358 RepID=A0ABQ1ZDU9_9BACL|nr:glycosyltransferase family 2 protein [Paenibacillus silvae]GGH58129.1 hypothetical protein GCM10008014_30440 [Paenibacillus silvae]